jgi:ABC-type Fe3+-siderophore transport system permease subunit
LMRFVRRFNQFNGWASLANQPGNTHIITVSPKAITAVLVGMGLSVSGLLMQTLFRNPLAGPRTGTQFRCKFRGGL